MDRIGTSIKTKEILGKYPFVFQKKYGQNFLIDTHVLNKIIDSSNITKEDCVLEIGPGIGSLTQILAERAKNVIAVEIDHQLIPILQDTLKEYDNIEIIHNDILKVDLHELIQEKNDGKPIKVVANLPYYITTPIIMNLLENHLPVQSITVMIQKEVAQRLNAKPGSKEYGAISLAIQYYCETYIAANVPQHCFIPRPNVDSAVIRLTVLEKPSISVKDSTLLFKIIKGAFAQRRKTLVNALYNTNSIPLSKQEISDLLQQIGLDVNIRGEALTLLKFGELTDQIYDYMHQ